ncbi:MAG: CoA-binding protein [Coprobacillus sp.]|nr:CoA-binding protein [Coprobacillus sp.]MCI9093782.1 CoA-binding protein [Coprobacillus sp.]
MEPIDILKKYYHFAVIGVSQNTDKYGYKIFKRLRDRSYDVYGVSPIYDQVDNIPLYSSLEDINGPIDVVVFVVNKKYAYDYIDEMTSLGIHYAWMQPHTYDDELLKHMKSVGITPILACILVETSL